MSSGDHSWSTVEALAARATVSAQETVCGHASSSAALISSITSNPLIEFLLGIAFFSLTTSSVSSKRTDASHPCNSILMHVGCLVGRSGVTKRLWLSSVHPTSEFNRFVVWCF